VSLNTASRTTIQKAGERDFVGQTTPNLDNPVEVAYLTDTYPDTRPDTQYTDCQSVPAFALWEV
jgi:hypothetical protein